MCGRRCSGFIVRMVRRSGEGCVCCIQLSTHRELALAGFRILIKVPPPEFRQGLSGLGLPLCVHTSVRLDALFDLRRSGSPNRAGFGGQAVIRPRPSLRRRQDAKVESRHGRFAMRKTRCLAFIQRERQHVLAALILGSGLALAGPGCHQHYHYYNTDPCAPGTPVSSTVRSGPLCEPQASIVDGRTTVVDDSPRSTTVTGGQSKSPRVVVSEPGSSSRFSSWRRSDSDGLATTSVQGTIDDATVNK
jgi:hypothetical protein